MDNDAINTVIDALKSALDSMPTPEQGFQVVEYYWNNDVRRITGEMDKSVRIHVWGNRTTVCWGFDGRFVTRTTYHKGGDVTWECSINWLTEEQCERLVELDGDWHALRDEINPDWRR